MLWPFWLEMDLVLIVAEAMEKPDSLVDGMAMREVSHMIMARVCMMPWSMLPFPVKISKSKYKRP